MLSGCLSFTERKRYRHNGCSTAEQAPNPTEPSAFQAAFRACYALQLGIEFDPFQRQAADAVVNGVVAAARGGGLI
jgi:hypothetical protein